MSARLFWLFLCILLYPQAAEAQAWPQAQGGVYAKIAHGRASAAQQFTYDGTLKRYHDDVAGDAFFDRSAYLYAEYGLTPRLTLVGLLPVKQLTVRDATSDRTTTGLGSVMTGVRYGLDVFGPTNTRHALAANVMATLPTGYSRNLTPSIGPGQIDLQGVLSYGLSLWPLPLYAQGGLGLRLRSGIYALSRTTPCTTVDASCAQPQQPRYDHEWLFSAEAGASLGPGALLQALVFGVWSNEPPETAFDPANPFPTHTRYIKTGVGLTIYPRRPIGIGIQYFTTPYGRNTIRSADWFFHLEYAPL